ncbi:hypothetical protein RugamoR64_29320 [Duganella rhizosphaerae]|uniref:hypothetical protein n=1 Tax=Duganella rhizosphaerae TaxID=2885763 RepID=UPI0030E9FE57
MTWSRTILACLAMSTTPHPAVAASPSDQMPLPPACKKAVSTDGHYLFEACSTDQWRSRHATGRLMENTAHGTRTVWERPLPQEYGPRYVVVGRQGQVVLFDEAINVKSRYAVVLMRQAERGDVIHAYEAVRLALGQSAAAIMDHAQSGWWLQGAPSLNAAGTQALAPVANTFLAVDLETGALSVLEPGR